MKDIEKVALLKSAGFGGMDKFLFSKLSKPDVYGVQLTGKAKRALSPKSNLRREKSNVKKITFRMKKEEFDQLQLAQKRLECESLCEAINLILQNYIGGN